MQRLQSTSTSEEFQMREKEIEKKFVQAVKRKGGYAVKFVSPGFDGMPDRLVLMPDAKVCFAELKASGKHPRILQKARHRMLKELGFKVFVVDSKEKIQEVLDAVQTT